MPITVSIIEDDPGTLHALAALIDGWPEFSCASKHAKPADALQLIPKTNPDVIIADLELGKKETGIDCIRALKQRLPKTPILVYTQHDHATWLFPALVEGASGYILKSEPAATLIDAISAAHRGESPMSSQIARQVLKFFHAKSKISHEIETLTPREYQILDLAAKGNRDSEIAQQLHISTRTVGSHFRNIYEKLHVRSKSHAVAKFSSSRTSL
jgi:DNA-binding NarL/FixJ family response regulator